MKVTEQLKTSVASFIRDDFGKKQKKDNKYSQVRHANYLGINQSIYSRVLKGDIDRVLSDGEWVRVGMELGVDMNGTGWEIATTATFNQIYLQLEYCQKNSLSAVFCDEKGIGKTTAAQYYARRNDNVAYVDCSLVKTKHLLIREIARKFGFDSKGKLNDVRNNLIENLRTLDKPLLILDEAGDLAYDAFLEIKAIWNALEYLCGFYLLGANGLKAKIDRQINNKKVGYEEIFDRHGDRYQTVYANLSSVEQAMFKRYQCEVVLQKNLPKLDKKAMDKILNDCGSNLRRLRIEIVKYKNPVS